MRASRRSYVIGTDVAREVREVGLDAEARRIGQRRPIRRRPRAGNTSSRNGFGIRVDLGVAVCAPAAASACIDAASPTPPASQCGQYATPRAAACRATSSPPPIPPHLPTSGCTNARYPRIDRASKASRPRRFSPAASGTALAAASARHASCGLVGGDRLLDPVRRERRELGDARGRLVGRPRLVRVDHDRRVGAERVAHRGEVRDVALGAEADLELERAIAFGAPRERDLGDAIGPDAARVDAHARLGRRGASTAARRRDAPPCPTAPGRRAPMTCANGPGSPHWIAICARAALEQRAHARPDRRRRRPSSSGAKSARDEARAMLGADLRKIAEHLAPARTRRRSRRRAGRPRAGSSSRRRRSRPASAIGARNTQHSTFSMRASHGHALAIGIR